MLTPEQRKQLSAAAIAAGKDPAKLLALADHMSGGATDAGGSDVSGDGKTAKHGAKGDEKTNDGAPDKPKLFMYLLPYVKVREVRRVFLGLNEAFPGDDEIASDWASKHPMASPTDSTPQE